MLSPKTTRRPAKRSFAASWSRSLTAVLAAALAIAPLFLAATASTGAALPVAVPSSCIVAELPALTVEPLQQEGTVIERGPRSPEEFPASPGRPSAELPEASLFAVPSPAKTLPAAKETATGMAPLYSGRKPRNGTEATARLRAFQMDRQKLSANLTGFHQNLSSLFYGLEQRLAGFSFGLGQGLSGFSSGLEQKLSGFSFGLENKLTGFSSRLQKQFLQFSSCIRRKSSKAAY